MTGIELIAQERQKQIEKGYTADEKYNPNEELVKAAICYAMPSDMRIYDYSGKPIFWPWNRRYFNPSSNNRIRELQIAGALIAAEIDRLQALEGKENV